MKILVCGASGLLGREICNMLNEKNIEYIGTYNSKIIDQPNYFKFDLENLDNFINNHKPDCIINCIVNRFVDDCELKWNNIKEINIDIAEKLASYNIRIIHISTDYVFDGKASPYNPDSLKNPLQNYGISKYISELRIMNISKNYLIIRVPVLFTNKYSNLNETAVTVLGKKLMDLTLKSSYEDNISIRRPVYIPYFVNFIYDSIVNKNTGIYHFYNPYDKMTKYDMIQNISDIIGKSCKHIKPSYELSNRPYDTQLHDDKYDIAIYYKDHNFNNILESCFLKFYHPTDFKDCFLLIDLDGTLVDSERQHYESYREITDMHIDDFNIRVQNNDFPFTNEVKNKKDLIFKTKIKDIKLMPGSENFIDFIHKKNINHCVVTNTSQDNVTKYKEHIPQLNKLKNWITKDDYVNRKPSPECYDLAIKKFYSAEKYIIGFENSIAGYKALKPFTDIIYFMINNNNLIINYDVFTIDSFECIIK